MADKKNVVIAGPIRVFSAVAGTELPADTVTYGGAWGGSWTDHGLTDGGASFEESIERAYEQVDQYLHPVTGDAVKAEAKMTVRMAESVLGNIRLARGIGPEVDDDETAYVLDGASTAGEDDEPIAIAVEGRGAGSTPGAPVFHRLVMYVARGGGVPGQEYKVDGKVMVEAEFTGEVDETKTPVRAWRERIEKVAGTEE